MGQSKQEGTRARVYAQTDQPSANLHDTFVRRVLITVGIVSGVGLLLLLLAVSIEVLLVVFAGILLAVLLRSLADLLSQYTPLPRGWSLLVVVLALLALFGVGGVLLAPSVADQTTQLVEAVPEALVQLEGWIEQFPLGQQLLSRQPDVDQLFEGGFGALLVQAGGIFSTTLGVLIETIVVLFLGVYLAINPGKYINGVIHLVPIEKRPRAREVIDKLGFTLKWFLLGRLMAMIVVGIVSTIGLYVLGVPLALVFGIITTVLTFVPYVGPIVAAILPALVALTVDPWLSVYVLLLFLVIQNLEGYLLTPLILQGTVSVPPALTIIAEVLFGILFGVLGIILATPFIAIAVVLVQMLYVQDVLGDQISIVGDHADDDEEDDEQPSEAAPEPKTRQKGVQPQ